MGKININDLEDYLSDDADHKLEEKIRHKRKKSSIYNNNTDQKLEDK